MVSVLELAGKTVGSYVLRSLIGEGGMGAVYLAEHQSLGRKAALKVLKRELATDKTVLARFQEEARAASNVIHPNIVHIYDIGTLPDGLPFIVMEFLDGESLGRRLSRGPTLPLDEALGIAAQAASALEAVHAMGIVHRDLKPDNLFLTPDPVVRLGLRVKVLDFGVAKLRGDLSVGGARTREGALVGTPLYMSPEQCRGLVAEVDHRSDIYALGLILYQMLAGQPPFNAPTFGDLIVQHISRPPPPLPASLGIPPRVEAAVMTALAKAPADRFASMTDFRRALLAAGGKTQTHVLSVAAAPASPESFVSPDLAARIPVSSASGPRLTRLYDSVVRSPTRAPTTTLSSAAAQSTAVTLPRSRGPWVLASIGLLVVSGLVIGWRLLPRAPDPGGVTAARAPAAPTASVSSTRSPPLEEPVPRPLAETTPSGPAPPSMYAPPSAGTPAAPTVAAPLEAMPRSPSLAEISQRQATPTLAAPRKVKPMRDRSVQRPVDAAPRSEYW